MGETVALGSTTEAEDDTDGWTDNTEDGAAAEDAAEDPTDSTLVGAILLVGAPDDSATRHSTVKTRRGSLYMTAIVGAPIRG